MMTFKYLGERQKMKHSDYITQVNLKLTDQLVADEKTELLAYIPGALNDEYLLASGGVTVSATGRKHKPRKYLILTYKFQTTWSNSLYCIETDSELKANEFIKRATKDGELYA